MALRPYTIEDSSPIIQYNPRLAWSNGNTSDNALENYSQGSFMMTNTSNASAQFTFNGTGVWMYGSKRANHGPYQCSLDGAASPQQNGQSLNAPQFQTQLCGFDGLTMQLHTITITNRPTDLINAPYLDIDFIELETKISDQASVHSPTTTDDANPSVVYSGGGWQTNQCDSIQSYLGTTCHVTSASNASVSYSFRGDAIAVYGGIGPDYGPYSVTLDNASRMMFNSKWSISRNQQVLYFGSGLGPGNHTVTLTNEARLGTSNFDVDYFQNIAPFNAVAARSKLDVGAIVGGVVGGVALLLSTLLALFVWRRRRQGTRRLSLDLGEGANQTPGPRLSMAMFLTPYDFINQRRQARASLFVDSGTMEPSPATGDVKPSPETRATRQVEGAPASSSGRMSSYDASPPAYE